MVLLAAAPERPVAQIAALVREREATGLRGRTRERAEGLEGCPAAPRPGRPAPMTEAD
jgi:hypothetical protein